MARKLFGGLRMTWPRLILFAVISGIVTALIALLVPQGNSIKQIAVTFEAWIVLAIIIVVNCETPLEAACKTFIYFLISQPLVYLIQVPFSSMGWKLFGYYTYWFYWTLATFPGAFIAWYIKRDDWIAAVIHSVALVALIWIGTGYLKQLIGNFPQYLLATLFCFGIVPVLIFSVHHNKAARVTASVIAAAAFALFVILAFAGSNPNAYSANIGLDENQFPVTEGWTAELEDPENGTVDLETGGEYICPSVRVEFKDYTKNTNVILRDPDGNAWLFPIRITKDGNTLSISY
ncbi:MAG: hypothetical protein J5841_05350 [Clostridia bacterium]|nr:hypothetical protein [Clostridia bacterium]